MDNEFGFGFGNLFFKIGESVGDWGNDYNKSVYEASVQVMVSNVSYPYGDSTVVVKIAPDTDVEAKSFLKQELNDQKIFKIAPKNILLHHHSFKTSRNNVKSLVVVLPHEKEVVSIRQTLNSQWPTIKLGIHEDCISIALQGAAKGLSEIHLCKKFHKRLTVGTIYYHKTERNIKLAYGASLYERNDVNMNTPNSSLSCPMSRLSQWARAPEIESLRDEGFTSACDVWLFGIAALEMAYGKIEVASRDELLFIADSVSKKHYMPPTWDDLREEFRDRNRATVSLKAVGYFLGRCLKFLSNLAFSRTQEEKQTFSKEFVNLVCSCLERDPQRRPSSLMLPTHQFFSEAVSSLKFFEKRLQI